MIDHQFQVIGSSLGCQVKAIHVIAGLGLLKDWVGDPWDRDMCSYLFQSPYSLTQTSQLNKDIK